MSLECYRVLVPEDTRLAGYTAAGRRVRILPGEYVVHKMRPKVPLGGACEALRFVGADERGRDLHIPIWCEGEVADVLRLPSGGAAEMGGAGESSRP